MLLHIGKCYYIYMWVKYKLAHTSEESIGHTASLKSMWHHATCVKCERPTISLEYRNTCSYRKEALEYT